MRIHMSFNELKCLYKIYSSRTTRTQCGSRHRLNKILAWSTARFTVNNNVRRMYLFIACIFTRLIHYKTKRFGVSVQTRRENIIITKETKDRPAEPCTVEFKIVHVIHIKIIFNQVISEQIICFSLFSPCLRCDHYFIVLGTSEETSDFHFVCPNEINNFFFRFSLSSNQCDSMYLRM